MANKKDLSRIVQDKVDVVAYGIKQARSPLPIRIIKFIGKSFIFWIVWAIVVKLLADWIFSTFSKGF